MILLMSKKNRIFTSLTDNFPKNESFVRERLIWKTDLKKQKKNVALYRSRTIYHETNPPFKERYAQI